MRTCIVIAASFLTSGAMAAPPDDVIALTEQMSEAVLAGDPDAYLALVDDSDPQFFQEQRMWAADLLRVTPDRFEIEIEVRDVEVVGDEAWAEVRQVWSLPDDFGLESFVEYPMQFVRTDDEWKFAGRRWEVLDGPGVRVFYPAWERDGAAAIVEKWPDIISAVHADLLGSETAPPPDAMATPVHVKLYDSQDTLKESISLSYRMNLGGWNEPGESIKLDASVGHAREGVGSVLAHEYAHAVMFAMGDESKHVPWWVSEGVAEFTSDRFAGKRDQVYAQMRERMRRGRIVKWSALQTYDPHTTRFISPAYSQGHMMLVYIADRFGSDAMRAWLTAMCEGASLEDATSEHLGITFDQLDDDWRESYDVEFEPDDGA